jgi:hypothetical protein
MSTEVQRFGVWGGRKGIKAVEKIDDSASARGLPLA